MYQIRFPSHCLYFLMLLMLNNNVVFLRLSVLSSFILGMTFWMVRESILRFINIRKVSTQMLSFCKTMDRRGSYIKGCYPLLSFASVMGFSMVYVFSSTAETNNCLRAQVHRRALGFATIKTVGIKMRVVFNRWCSKIISKH